jgi:protease-4
VLFTLEGEYPDIPSPKQGLLRSKILGKKLSLKELGEQFDQVANDRKVRGVVINIASPTLSIAQLQTVRGFLKKLNKAGKQVISWASNYNTSSFYLAASSDEIIIARGGSIAQLGLSQSYIFLGDALKQIGLKGDFVQISPYKTASDSLTRSQMSEAAREMANWLLDDIYNVITGDIAADRNTDQDSIRKLIDGAPYTDEQALEMRAVDRIANQEEIPIHLGINGRQAKIVSYSKCRKALVPRPLDRPGKYVALIRVEGDIVDGKSSYPPVKPPFRLPLFLNPRAGDQTIVEQARNVLKDKRAKALILFVDSGGGSATASEAMSSALRNLAEKKPVVCYMASLAASGGYYVSTPAKYVVAQPGTITGSIGVLSGKVVNTGMLEKLFINEEVLQRGQSANFFNWQKPFTQEEREKLLTSIRHTYKLFLERVSSARKMTSEDVDAIGGGRVWTGKQALERGLVDELGGLEAAVSKACELAGIHPRTTVKEIHIPKTTISSVPSTAALLSYANEGINHLQPGLAMCICPLVIKN